MSFIKAALEKSNPLYMHQNYDNRTLKPFTFSVYFPGLKGAKNDSLNVGNKATLFFSTHNPILATYLYNGAQQLQKHKWKKIEFEIKGITIQPLKKFKVSHLIFKTLGPFLVNNEKEPLNYLYPKDDGFEEALRYSVGLLCREFLAAKNVQFDYKFIRYKKIVVSHYNQFMTGTSGKFQFKADPEILNLLYNVGIGVRRNQGFGMLEVVKGVK